MKLYRSPLMFPELNLALEEVLLKEKDDFILLYINGESVVCGKHQVPMAEINAGFCQEMNIPIYRRLSGGGTVYHDPGNINFSIFQSKDSGKQVDFEGFTAPIIAFLKTLGLNATFGGHHDIRIGEFKVSGNAEHVYKNRVMHHGTLLFDSDLDQLKAALQLSGASYSGFRVQSVPASVRNILDLLDDKLDFHAFYDGLLKFLSKYYNATLLNELEDDMYQRCEELAVSKYNDVDWVFGHSPDYQFDKEDGPHRLKLNVSRGIISEAHFHSKDRDIRCVDFQEMLPGKWHTPQLADELSNEISCLSRQELRNLLG